MNGLNEGLNQKLTTNFSYWFPYWLRPSYKLFGGFTWVSK